MRNALAVFMFWALCSAAGFGQIRAGQSLNRSDLKPIQPPPLFASVSYSNEPLLLLGSQETDYASLVVDPKEIIVVQIYKDSAILAEMGHKARNGVLLIKLKNQKTPLKMEDVLDYFEVPIAQRQLRVLVNKQPVNREHFLADIKRIIKIEVITLDKISPSRISWDENEQFLNIVTIQQAQL